GAAASIARLMASVSSVFPSPVAPKARTLKSPARSAGCAEPACCAPAISGIANPVPANPAAAWRKLRLELASIGIRGRLLIQSQRALPDAAALRPRPLHTRAGLASPCLGERRHVRERAVRAELRQRVLVCFGQQPRGFGTVDPCPNLRESQEESLVRRKSTSFLGRFSFGSVQEGGVRDREPAQVGDAFTLHQL